MRRTERRIHQQILITVHLYGFKALCSTLIKIRSALNPYRRDTLSSRFSDVRYCFYEVVVAMKSVKWQQKFIAVCSK